MSKTLLLRSIKPNLERSLTLRLVPWLCSIRECNHRGRHMGRITQAGMGMQAWMTVILPFWRLCLIWAVMLKLVLGPDVHACHSGTFPRIPEKMAIKICDMGIHAVDVDIWICHSAWFPCIHDKMTVKTCYWQATSCIPSLGKSIQQAPWFKFQFFLFNYPWSHSLWGILPWVARTRNSHTALGKPIYTIFHWIFVITLALDKLV